MRLIISPRESDRGLYVYQARPRTRRAPSPGGFTRYENEDGRNKSDVGGSSESFLKAPRVTRQVYAETSIIPLTCFIASWANSAVPVLRFTAFVTPFFFFFFFFFLLLLLFFFFFFFFFFFYSTTTPSLLRPLLPLTARICVSREENAHNRVALSLAIELESRVLTFYLFLILLKELHEI